MNGSDSRKEREFLPGFFFLYKGENMALTGGKKKCFEKDTLEWTSAGHSGR
jgi:hypothetical protein